MKQTTLFSLRCRVALRGIGHVLTRPRYLAVLIIGCFLASSAILWSLNVNLVSYILFEAPISVVEKIDFFSSVYRTIISSYGSIHAMSIVLFSVLFGLNTSLFVYVFRNSKNQLVSKKSSVGGLFFAVIGGGCLACGTSLLAPLLASLGAASIGIVRVLSNYFLWAGSVLILFSIFQLAQAAAPVKE